MQHKCLILIPARYQSSRFPGKPLAPIFKRPLVQHVYEKSLKVANTEVYVVTDDDRIEAEVKKWGNVLRVGDDVPSGSERIFLAWQRELRSPDVDLIINVQGDEPMLNPEDLSKLVHFHLNSDFEVSTLVKKRSSDQKYLSHDVVKVAYTKKTGECHWFTRSSLPVFRGDHREQTWFQHIGVYCYKPAALSALVKLSKTKFEVDESLEQLRLLENGYRYGAIETTSEYIGVDRAEDIKRVEEVMNEATAT